MFYLLCANIAIFLASDEFRESVFSERTMVEALQSLGLNYTPGVLIKEIIGQYEEGLGYTILFRNEDDPFTEEQEEALNVIMPPFARQLNKIVEVHYRLLLGDAPDEYGPDVG